MKKIKIVKYIWLAAALLSVLLGAAAIAGILISSLKLLYIPLVISLIFAAHAFYGTPFYFIAYSNMRLTERAAEAVVAKGLTELSDIAECINLNSDFCRKLLEKAIRKNYIPEISKQ